MADNTKPRHPAPLHVVNMVWHATLVGSAQVIGPFHHDIIDGLVVSNCLLNRTNGTISMVRVADSSKTGLDSVCRAMGLNNVEFLG
jgi:hypothetical protein